MIRLIALDIDGTTTDSNHEVRPSTREALVEALDAGIEVVLATGRVLSTTRPVIEAIDPRLGAIVNNGALAWPRLDEPPLWTSYVPAAVARDVVGALAELGLDAYVFHAVTERVAVPSLARLPAPFARRFEGLIDEVGDVAAWIRDDPLMLTTMVGDDAAAERLVKAQTVILGERFAARCTVSPLWHPLYGRWILDFIAPGVGKWTALERWAALRGYDGSAILAVGDGLNDIEMVSRAGIGVAMGQACPELLAVADAVVADCDHDGLAEAVRRFALAR